MTTRPCIRRVPDGRLILWCDTPDQAVRLSLAMTEGLLRYVASGGNPNTIAKGKFARAKTINSKGATA